MIRTYKDLTGKKRRLKWIRGGPYFYNYVICEASWHSYWTDLDTGESIQIPDKAWLKLKMAYEDTYEKEGIGDRPCDGPASGSIREKKDEA